MIRSVRAQTIMVAVKIRHMISQSLSSSVAPRTASLTSAQVMLIRMLYQTRTCDREFGPRWAYKPVGSATMVNAFAAVTPVSSEAMDHVGTHEFIELKAQRAGEAYDGLQGLLAALCTPRHRYHDHEDGQKPWCDDCGYNEWGIRIKKVERHD